MYCFVVVVVVVVVIVVVIVAVAVLFYLLPFTGCIQETGETTSPPLSFF